MLSSTFFWSNILTPATYAWVIDTAVNGLFGWRSEFLDHKAFIYRHLYSSSSVKIVVHWFQIIKSKRFQMYEDEPSLLPNGNNSAQLVPHYPTVNIQTPVALLYGGRGTFNHDTDSLPDLNFILSSIPEPVLILKIEEYEHLHFLWGSGQAIVTYPAIIGLLDRYSEVWSDAAETQEQVEMYRTVPWITEKQILWSLQLGTPRVDQTHSRIGVANISVAKALQSGKISMSEYSCGKEAVTYISTTREGLTKDCAMNMLGSTDVTSEDMEHFEDCE